MFRWQDGLLHLVFCNEDCYLRDSFVSLDLTDELHYRLTRQGYQVICFVSGQGSAARVELLDARSDNKFPYGPMDWLFQGEFAGQRTLEWGADRLGKSLCRLLAQPRCRCALVFRQIEDFNALIRDYPPLWEGLRSARESIIVLLAAPSARQALPLLTDGAGALAREDYVLCPQLGRVVRGGSSDLFRDLQEQMRDRLVFLNELSSRTVQTILEYWVLFGGGPAAPQRDLEDAAFLIYTWYHAPQMQLDERFSGLLPENPTFSRSRLEECLPRVWGPLMNQLELLRREAGELPVSALLAQRYPVQPGCPVEADTHLAQRVASLMRRAVQNGVDSAFGVAREQLLGLRCRYATYCSQPPAPIIKDLLLRCVKWGEEAIPDGDGATFRRCLRLLELAHSRRLQWQEEERDGWHCWHTLLEYSRYCFQMSKRLRELEGQAEACRQACAQCQAELARLREQGFGEQSVGAQRQRKLLKERQEELGRLRERIQQTEAMEQGLRQDLAKLERYADQFCTAPSTEQMEQVREQAQQAMAKIQRTQDDCRVYLGSSAAQARQAPPQTCEESSLLENWLLDY